MRKAASQESTSQAENNELPRDRHGHNRGLQPPATFDFDALAAGQLLTELEAASVLRLSSNTLAVWRTQPAHPLRWLRLPNGHIRYKAGSIRAYMAMGAARQRKPSPAPAAKAEIRTDAAQRRPTRRVKAKATVLAAPAEPAR